MLKRVIMLVVVVVSLSAPVLGTRYSFVPDWTFKGNTLAGWRVLGQADWKAANGELVGRAQVCRRRVAVAGQVVAGRRGRFRLQGIARC